MNLIELGLEIKKARLEQGIQQEELSAFASLSRATLSRLENGRLAELGIRKVMALCERLGLELTLQQVRKRPTLRTLAKESQHAAPAMGALGPKRGALVADESSAAHEAVASVRKRVRRARKAKGGEE